jgi:hypothetical protein
MFSLIRLSNNEPILALIEAASFFVFLKKRYSEKQEIASNNYLKIPFLY